MLVVCAVEGHFDLVHVFRVGMGVVHGAVAGGFVVRPGLLVLGEGDGVGLLFGFGRGAELVAEAGFVVLLEVVAVGVGDGDVVEEFGAAEHEAFFPGGGFAEELFGVVGEDAEDEFVVGFGGGGGVFVLHAEAGAAAARFVFGVERRGLEDDAGFGVAFEDGADVGVGADGDAFGAEIVGPLGVELGEVGEGDHEREVGEESFGVVVPEFHVRVVEETFEDGAGDVGRLIAWAC